MGAGSSSRQAGPSGALPRGLGPHSHPAAADRAAACSPRPDGRLRTRGRGRSADAARARPEPGPAQPVSAAGGRRWPLLPPFSSASASCSPRHAHRAPSPSPPSRGRTPPRLGPRRPLRCPCAAGSVAVQASDTELQRLARASRLGVGTEAGTPHCACAAAGPFRGAGPEPGRRSRSPGKRRRAWRFPGQPPGESAREGGGGAGRVGWRSLWACLRPPLAKETAGNESAWPGRPRSARADRIGGHCLRGDFPLPAFASTGGSLH